MLSSIPKCASHIALYFAIAKLRTTVFYANLSATHASTFTDYGKLQMANAGARFPISILRTRTLISQLYSSYIILQALPNRHNPRSVNTFDTNSSNLTYPRCACLVSTFNGSNRPGGCVAANLKKMTHDAVWFSRPRKFGKGSRQWYAAQWRTTEEH